MTVQELVAQLNLRPHPEGGYYKEVYRSTAQIPGGSLPGFAESRSVATAIYFLIEANNFSALHKIKSDETWHFYAGDALEVVEINEEGVLKTTLVGSNLAAGECFQYTVPASTWFGSRVKQGGKFALVGCTVAPGFDFADFEMGARAALLNQFPQHGEVILALARQ